MKILVTKLIAHQLGAFFLDARLLPRVLWCRRKGRYVRRTPLTLRGRRKRPPLNRPMLSNTSCSVLLAPGCSTAASVCPPP